MLGIKALLDFPASIGEPIYDNEHLDVLIECIPTEYDSFLSLIHNKSELFLMNEISSHGDTISLNLAHAKYQTVVHLTHM